MEKVNSASINTQGSTMAMEKLIRLLARDGKISDHEVVRHPDVGETEPQPYDDTRLQEDVWSCALGLCASWVLETCP